jgi:hypothetical protein
VNAGPVDTLPLHRSFAGFTVLEYWPDENRNEVYVWIDNPGTSDFLKLRPGTRFSSTLRAVLAPLHSSGSALPPVPHGIHLRELYHALFQPLEKYVQHRRILIIPHKILQALPFEFLQDDNGGYLLDDYLISYLPNLDPRFAQGQRIDAPPALYLPSGFSHREGASRELRELSQFTQDLRIHRHLDKVDLFRAQWAHISTHFSPDHRFWLASTFSSGKEVVSVAELLQKRWSCELLSLGVCESANGFSFVSPYWLGVSELFLSRGIQSLVASRWKLDEASSQIFVDFHRYCQSGMAFDEALSRARAKIRTRVFNRNGTTATGQHPYFWAGISYVGWPGRKLSGASAPDIWAGLGILVAVLIVLLISATRGDGYHRRRLSG